MSTCVLLAEDDASLRFVLQQALGKEGYNVRATSSVSTLAKWVREGEGDLVLSDVYMGDECVFDALPSMRTARPNLPVVVMSAQSTVSTALSASGAGAFDYVPKPFDLDHLIAVVRNALAGEPDAKTRALASRAAKDSSLPLIGRSPAMQEVYRTIARVAATDLTVLLEGESGTGKERVARAIHDNSRRAASPFVVASLAGAVAARVDRELSHDDGAFVLARGGTLFLENIDELPSDAQARIASLLNAEEDPGRPAFRLIAASQRPLEPLMRQGLFRQDLYYRLNVVQIKLPPLRARTEDIGDLARAFLIRAKKEGLPDKTIDTASIARLQTHTFPGNVRELENLLRRAAALSPGGLITERAISALLAPSEEGASPDASDLNSAIAEYVTGAFAAAAPNLPPTGLYDRLIMELERPLIELTLQATRGNQIRAAQVLGLNRNTLRKKIQALGLNAGKAD